MSRVPAVMVVAFLLRAGAADALESAERPASLDRILLELDLELYRTTQRAGMALFGAGLGLELVGMALTQVDPWGPIGLSGFATLGAGIAVATAGMITMAVSRRRWQSSIREHGRGDISWFTAARGREPG